MRAFLVVVLLLSASCSNPASESVTVFAASSLTEAFSAVGQQFEREHGKRVRFNFAGSQTLRLQIEHGARADVFATADEEHLRALEGSGDVRDAGPLVSNELVAVVARDSAIRSFEDLRHAERIVVGAPTAPIGRYTRAMLGRLDERMAADLAARVVSEENNVRMVRSKVELGVADAAFVYRTDVVSSSKLRAIELPSTARVHATYGVARVGGPSERGEAFLAYLRSPAATQILVDHGFGELP